MSVEVEIVKSHVLHGRKVEEVREFHDVAEAAQFVKDFNSLNDPDYVVDTFSFARMVDRRKTDHQIFNIQY